VAESEKCTPKKGNKGGTQEWFPKKKTRNWGAMQPERRGGCVDTIVDEEGRGVWGLVLRNRGDTSRRKRGSVRGRAPQVPAIDYQSVGLTAWGHQNPQRKTRQAQQTRLRGEELRPTWLGKNVERV